MVEEMFVAEAGQHEGHRVRITAHGLVKTGMKDGEAVTLRNQTVLHCSCGDVWNLPDGIDYKTAIEEIPKNPPMQRLS